MAVTATGRMTLGAVMGTISNTAGAVSSIVNTGVKGVVMLDNFVESALSEQKKRHALDGVLFDERLLLELSTESAHVRIEADKFCDQSTKHAEHFNSSYAKLAAVLSAMSAKT